MTDPSPAEGVARQLRKAIDDRREQANGRVKQELADIVTVVETAERLNLRTHVLDLKTHEKLMASLESISPPAPRKKHRLSLRRNRKARAELPMADESGQLTLPFGDL